MTMPTDDTNGHSLPIQWENHLVAYILHGYVVVAVRGRHPDNLFPSDFPVGSLEPAQAQELGLQLQRLAQELLTNDSS